MVVDLNHWVVMVGNFGFPVVVAIYLLIRFEKKIQGLTTVIYDLKEAMIKLKKEE